MITHPNGCEGGCEEHVEPVSRVRVKGKDGHDFGLWWYCEAAQQEDKRRGFEVTQEASDGN